MRLEGGYQGRTNKLVDGCYSFWQGGAVALLPRHRGPATKRESCDGTADSTSCDGEGGSDYDPDELLMDTTRLQRYILRCCQRTDGGLRDKPSKYAPLVCIIMWLSGTDPWLCACVAVCMNVPCSVSVFVFVFALCMIAGVGTFTTRATA